jgi:hypothetical protein
VASAPAPIPVAAPAPAAPLLTGPARAVRVAAVTPFAAYLTTGDADVPVLCLATRAAVRLPCALVSGLPELPRWRVGQAGLAGGGGLRAGGIWWPVTRWWRPARPRAAGAAPKVLGTAAATLARYVDALEPGLHRAAGDLTAALRAGTDPGPAVRGLLGRGPGLTPLGDDVLAGALVTLSAYDRPEAGALAGAVAAASWRTTAVSTALLAHAARGECVAALAGLIGAVDRAATEPDLARAVAAVTAIGHTSGAGLVHGVLAGIAAGARP